MAETDPKAEYVRGSPTLAPRINPTAQEEQMTHKAPWGNQDTPALSRDCLRIQHRKTTSPARPPG